MALRIIRGEHDEILRKQSKHVKEITASTITLLDDMRETLESVEGIGLAAPQVGVLKRIVIVDTGDEVLELINPEIIFEEGEQERSEGCLSIPGKTGTVKRPAKVKVKAQNRSGEYYEYEGIEVTAVAFCHEIDHLNGILYTDKALSLSDSDDDEDVRK